MLADDGEEEHRLRGARPTTDFVDNDDPYYLYEQQLHQAVEETYARFEEWQRLLRESKTSAGEFQAHNAKIMKSLPTLRENMATVNNIVAHVERNRAKYPAITDDEVHRRRNFSRFVENKVNLMSATLSSPYTIKKIEADRRDELARRRSNGSSSASFTKNRRGDLVEGLTEDGNSNDLKRSLFARGGGRGDYRNGKRDDDADLDDDDEDDSAYDPEAQQLHLKEQDESLDAISDSLTTLRGYSEAINEELGVHNELLGGMNAEAERVNSRFDATLGRLDKLLGAKSRSQTWTILFLTATLAFLIMLVSIT